VEGVTFHQAPIAGLLREGFVESRLHMDAPEEIDAAKWPYHRLLQDELIGSAAVPYYAILDPRTGSYLAQTRLHGGDRAGWARDIETFLTRARESASARKS
jgi:hypothetical protein